MTKYYFGFPEGSKGNQVICALLINMPAFVLGSSIGWMSPMSLLLQSNTSPRDLPLTDIEVSCIAAVAYSICVPAYFLINKFQDFISRKNTIFFLSAMGFGCWAIKLLSMNVWAFIVARTLVGILMAGCYVTCSQYTKEISEDAVKGTLCYLMALLQLTGHLLLYIIGDILSYRTILWVSLTIPAVHLVLFMMMPESPTYLVKTGNLDEAIRCLAWLRCRKENDIAVINEVIKIKKEQLEDQETSIFVLKTIVADKLLFRAFTITQILGLARDLSGSLLVLTFAGEIYNDVAKGQSLALRSNQQAMVLGTLQIVGSLLAFSLVDKLGRKLVLFISFLVSGLSMFAFASWQVARAQGLQAISWLPITSLCVSIFCYTFGLQPLSNKITEEMFSPKHLRAVMATSNAISSFCLFLQMLLFKTIVNVIGYHVVFYCFGAACLLTAVYVMLVVPETRMKVIDDIYEGLKTKKEKKLEREQRDKFKEIAI